jgi:ankyrin repeat protein
VFRLLLERGADPPVSDDLNNTPLIFACAGGHTEVVQSLPAHPSVAGSINHTNLFGRTALYYASANNHGRIVGLLLKHGADPTFATSYLRTVRDNPCPRAHPG